MKNLPSMSPYRIEPEGRQERGSALVLAIFVLVLLGAMGSGLLFLSQNELKMSQANLRAKSAFYMAEAGIEDGRRSLFDVNGGGSFADDLSAAAGGNSTIDFNPATVAANYDSTGTIIGLTGYGDDVPLRPLTLFTGSSSDRPGWYAAFLTNDPAEGRTNLSDGNSRVMITAVGAGAQRSLEVVQAIVEPISLLPPLPPAAITLLGPTPSFDSGSSAAQDYSGTDCAHAGGGVPNLYVPIVGTIGSDALQSAIDGMSGNPDYTSGTYSDEDTFVDLTDASNPLLAAAGGGSVDPTWTNCWELHDMIESLRAQATYYCDASCIFPATTNESITFVNKNNISLGPGHIGNGVLVITGRASFQGGTSFDGVLMVVGTGELVRAGGGTGLISGGTIVANIAGPDGVYGTGDDCTGGPNNDGWGVASYDVSGGGTADIDFCSNVLGLVNPTKTYKVVEFLQR